MLTPAMCLAFLGGLGTSWVPGHGKVDGAFRQLEHVAPLRSGKRRQAPVVQDQQIGLA